MEIDVTGQKDYWIKIYKNESSTKDLFIQANKSVTFN